MNIEQARSIPLAQILHKMNITPAQANIDEDEDVIRFICKYLATCGVEHSEPDAFRWLENMFRYAPVIKPVIDPDEPKKQQKLVVTKTGAIERPALIRHLDSIGTPLPVASDYLKQVTVYDRVSGKSVFALGFRNDKGGYEVFNNFLQESAGPRYISFIRGTIPKPDGIHIFKVLPDYFAAILQKNNGRRFEYDAIVLNAYSRMTHATPFIKGYGYRVACTWMDNSQIGKAATVSLDNFFKTEDSLLHKPMNAVYAPYCTVSACHLVRLGLAG